MFTSDLRVRIPATGVATYPDAAVICGRTLRASDDPLAVINPMVLVEVTSDSTANYDRGAKLEHYQTLPSVDHLTCMLTEQFDDGYDLDGVWHYVKSQSNSDSGPLGDVAVAQAAADVVRKAHAVGLIGESPDFTALTYPIVKRAVLRVREAGIGESAAAEVIRAGPDPAVIAARLREIGSLLEESPLPSTEWGRVLEIFDRDQIAARLGVSPASVVRYAKGERRTPDAVAARLHCLALIVGDLAGAYNEIGIRRWFERARTPLQGRSPAQILRGDWQPEDAGPRAVRELARALVSSPAT